MSEPFIAQIVMFGGNFAPRGWALCNGQIISIAQQTALFSILGTTYGGNGQTTFALPDLRGRSPMHPGQGPGLSPRTLGEVSGSESTTLSNSNIPPMPVTFNLGINVSTEDATTGKPFSAGVGNYLASNTTSLAFIPPGTGVPDQKLNAGAISGTAQTGGSGTPVGIMQPYLCVNFIIALEGIFPSRN
ncbi:MAG TPA: tail fiber protein [Pyrinomonadaceae bacterium]|jgi:microcystin-dependent protein|nr:tail fiber protein [Pyrinomonadaceae bacterium]